MTSLGTIGTKTMYVYCIIYDQKLCTEQERNKINYEKKLGNQEKKTNQLLDTRGKKRTQV